VKKREAARQGGGKAVVLFCNNIKIHDMYQPLLAARATSPWEESFVKPVLLFDNHHQEPDGCLSERGVMVLRGRVEATEPAVTEFPAAFSGRHFSAGADRFEMCAGQCGLNVTWR